jgi:death-on-curing family protein
MSIGHERDIRFLSVQEVEGVHMALVEDFAGDSDPIAPPGVRSQDLLASAVHRPSTALDGATKYPTVEMAAAAFLHALVHNHPFHNGNKRTALVAMLVFLDENGLVLTCDEDQLFKLVLQLAQHALAKGPRAELADREVLAVAMWLKENSRWIEKGDRSIPWRRLQRILMDYQCTFDFPGGGNRINISRSVTERTRFLGRLRMRVLRTQTFYGDQGREIDKNAVNKIRHDLHLDEEHGIDSSAFYDRSPISPSDFILRYRKTLKRLARL